jgi:hypothetical protein
LITGIYALGYGYYYYYDVEPGPASAIGTLVSTYMYEGKMSGCYHANHLNKYYNQ